MSDSPDPRVRRVEAKEKNARQAEQIGRLRARVHLLEGSLKRIANNDRLADPSDGPKEALYGAMRLARETLDARADA